MTMITPPADAGQFHAVTPEPAEPLNVATVAAHRRNETTPSAANDADGDTAPAERPDYGEPCRRPSTLATTVGHAAGGDIRSSTVGDLISQLFGAVATTPQHLLGHVLGTMADDLELMSMALWRCSGDGGAVDGELDTAADIAVRSLCVMAERARAAIELAERMQAAAAL